MTVTTVLAELGQTSDPDALVPGDPAAVRGYAATLTGRAGALTQAGDQLSQITTGEAWSGRAAEAFDARFAPHPAHWLTAGDAHRNAATALSHFADTLEWAKGQAGQAATGWDRAQAATTSAVNQYNSSAAAGIVQAPFVDPGAEARTAAQDMLARARAQLATAGDIAARTVTTAAQAAPESPSLLSRVGGAFGELVDWAEHEEVNLPALAKTVAGGALTAASGALTGASYVVGTASILADGTGAGTVVGLPAGVAAAGGITLGGAGMLLGTEMVRENAGAILAPMSPRKNKPSGSTQQPKGWDKNKGWTDDRNARIHNAKGKGDFDGNPDMDEDEAGNLRPIGPDGQLGDIIGNVYDDNRGGR